MQLLNGWQRAFVVLATMAGGFGLILAVILIPKEISAARYATGCPWEWPEQSFTPVTAEKQLDIATSAAGNPFDQFDHDPVVAQRPAPPGYVIQQGSSIPPPPPGYVLQGDAAQVPTSPPDVVVTPINKECKSSLENIVSGRAYREDWSSWRANFMKLTSIFVLFFLFLYAFGAATGWVWRGFFPRKNSR